MQQGSFTGVEGLLLSERGTDRLVISVAILQRSVAFEIDRSSVKPIGTTNAVINLSNNV